MGTLCTHRKSTIFIAISSTYYQLPLRINGDRKLPRCSTFNVLNSRRRSTSPMPNGVDETQWHEIISPAVFTFLQYFLLEKRSHVQVWVLVRQDVLQSGCCRCCGFVYFVCVCPRRRLPPPAYRHHLAGRKFPATSSHLRALGSLCTRFFCNANSNYYTAIAYTAIVIVQNNGWKCFFSPLKCCVPVEEIERIPLVMCRSASASSARLTHDVIDSIICKTRTRRDIHTNWYEPFAGIIKTVRAAHYLPTNAITNGGRTEQSKKKRAMRCGHKKGSASLHLKRPVDCTPCILCAKCVVVCINGVNSHLAGIILGLHIFFRFISSD